MSSYSCVDGLPGSGSREFPTRLLREELGFEGMVVADYSALILLMKYHRVATDRSEAAARAVTARLDLELPALDCLGAPLKAALAKGTSSTPNAPPSPSGPGWEPQSGHKVMLNHKPHVWRAATLTR